MSSLSTTSLSVGGTVASQKESSTPGETDWPRKGVRMLLWPSCASVWDYKEVQEIFFAFHRDHNGSDRNIGN